LLFDEMIIHLI